MSQTLTLTRDLERAQDRRRERDRAWADAVITVLADACPFPAVVGYTPDLELLRVRIPGVTVARMTYDEARREDSEAEAALELGLRAIAGYRALEPLEHDHQLGTE